MAEGPAEQAGILRGDRILQIGAAPAPPLPPHALDP